MPCKLTYEFVKDYIEKTGEYLLLSTEYINSKTKLKIKHLLCNTKYEVIFDAFSRGIRCPKCGGSQKLTYEEVKSYIESFEGYKLISEGYINTKTKLIVKHIECGTKYEVRFNDFKKGSRCPFCKGKKLSEHFKISFEEVKNYIESFENYKLISKEYTNNRTKLIIKHLKCGTKYEVTFDTFKSGKRCPFCCISTKSKFLGLPGKPLYDTYEEKLSFCEEVRRDPENEKIMQVRCKNSSCKKWFTPDIKQVQSRVIAIDGRIAGEYNFYCSEECKHNCSIYRQQLYPRGYKNYKDNLERDPYWRQLVLERDNYECQICGSTEKLEAHHIDSININPIMSADLENGITLCGTCHKKAHEDVGCRYIDLRKENICKEK